MTPPTGCHHLVLEVCVRGRPQIVVHDQPIPSTVPIESVRRVFGEEFVVEVALIGADAVT